MAIIFSFLLLTGIGCKEPEPFPATELDDRMSGGDATVFDAGSGAYGHMINGLSPRDQQVHAFGDKMFEASFVQGPAPVFAGLGPLYNQASCVSCHPGEGRGKSPESGNSYESMFFKVSMPGVDLHGGPLPVPGFGHQIQDRAVFGALPEAKVNIVWINSPFIFPDGEKADLRSPQFSVNSTYIPFPTFYLLSPRVGRPNFGMGLIESIEESSILVNADAEDRNKDGISGKPNYVYDPVNQNDHVLGRLGWKASVPSIKGQVSRALVEDMGATTSIFPNKAAEGQEQMKAAYLPSVPDVHDSVLHALVFYMQTLAVPARRNTTDSEVIRGQRLFKSIGCIKCHTDVHTTQVNVRFKPLSGQVIRPYSDFLLHDMGTGLADDRPEYQASGNEWRTPPLWGIGLSKRVSGHGQLLHDGRARNFTEAILWHGGEAQGVKSVFTRLSSKDRSALIRFLESL